MFSLGITTIYGSAVLGDFSNVKGDDMLQITMMQISQCNENANKLLLQFGSTNYLQILVVQKTVFIIFVIDYCIEYYMERASIHS